MRLLFTLLIALSVVVGCSTEKPTGPGSGEVTLTLNQAEYETGDTIILTVTNHLDHEISVNHCPGAEPEKFVLGDWEEVWPDPDVCIDILPPVLGPGSSLRYEFVPFDEAGTYRFLQVIWDDPVTHRVRLVHSDSFRVN